MTFPRIRAWSAFLAIKTVTPLPIGLLTHISILPPHLRLPVSFSSHTKLCKYFSFHQFGPPPYSFKIQQEASLNISDFNSKSVFWEKYCRAFLLSLSRAPGLSRSTRTVTACQDCHAAPGLSRRARTVTQHPDCHGVLGLSRSTRTVTACQDCHAAPGLSRRARTVTQYSRNHIFTVCHYDTFRQCTCTHLTCSSA